MNAARQQRGIALLIALLTVVLAAVLIAGLLDRGELAFARTRNTLRSEQAEAYADGLEAYAARVLIKDAEDTGDTNADIWAMPLPPQTVPGGAIRASMRDLNGCFNLNNLLLQARGGTTWAKMFTRLLDVLGLDRSVLGSVQDWLGAPGAPDDVNTTDAFYLAQPVPYRSAQRAFAHVSELRLVRGVTSEVYARLAPYVCALPPGTPINVNTASVPVLRTLGPGISEAVAESLWQNGKARWTGNFRQEWSNVAVDATEDKAGAVSSYFLARSEIDLDGVLLTFFSVIQRGGRCGLCVIERSRGGDAAGVIWNTPGTSTASPH
jgi:general secretion pathway protein K